VSVYDFPGLLSGLVAFQLVLWGAVIAVLAATRALLVRGQPGRGHVARGILAGAGVLVGAGLLLYAAADFLEWKRFMDARGAPGVAGLAVVGAVLLAVRLARRRPAPEAAGEVEATPEEGRPPR
jgi:hypothetical protein